VFIRARQEDVAAVDIAQLGDRDDLTRRVGDLRARPSVSGADLPRALTAVSGEVLIATKPMPSTSEIVSAASSKVRAAGVRSH
jgi:hypothetical protein